VEIKNNKENLRKKTLFAVLALLREQVLVRQTAKSMEQMP
jgi:hypothetical protein